MLSVMTAPGHASPATIAVLWRGDRSAEQAGIGSNERLRPVLDAFHALGATTEPIVYRDEIAASVLARLSSADGVLVWVDPIGKNGETRARLDALLRTVADRGVWVGSHPDVIDVIGTKDVLHRTRGVGWVDDVHRYRSLEELRDQLPGRLSSRARVLKPHRGNGGIGVWKVERVAGHPDGSVTFDTPVRVHEARVRDLQSETLRLGAFLDRCAGNFDDGGCVIDQPFQPRVAEGLIRVYLVTDEVVGFAIQGAGELLAEPSAAERIMGLPSPKTMFPPDEPRFTRLRTQLEHDWLPALQQQLELATEKLPALWDLDFLLGPRDAHGHDTYVLCEINASCITPYPPGTPPRLAATTLSILSTRRR